MKEGHMESGNRGLIVVLCVLLVMIVGLSVGLTVVMVNKDRAEEMAEDNLIVVDNDVTVVNDESEQDILNEITNIETELNSVSDDAEKAELYIDLANNLFDSMDSTGVDNRQQILEAVYTAYDLDQNLKTAYNVYLYEYTFGNAEEAAKYYEIAVSYGLPENPKGRG